MSSSTKSAVIMLGGLGSAPSTAQMLQLATQQAQVDVEPAAVRGMKKDDAQDDAQAHAYAWVGAQVKRQMPVAVVRIVITLKILELIKAGSKIRAGVVKLLCKMLNDNMLPGMSLWGPSEAMEGFAHKINEVCKLSDSEMDIIKQESTILNAYAVLCTEASKKLLSLSSAVACLSSEVFKADMRFLDQSALEAHGNKHVISLGMELRGMLEGSSTLSSSKGKKMAALLEVPFTHSIASQMLSELSKMVNIELKTPQNSFSVGKDLLHVQASSTQSLLSSVMQGILNVIALSMDRTNALCQELSALSEGKMLKLLQVFIAREFEQSKMKFENASSEASKCAQKVLNPTESNSSQKYAVGVAAAAAVDALQQALLVEAFAAVTTLRMKEGPGKEVQEPEPDAGGKGKKKNKKGKKGPSIGKGSAIVQKYFESACMKGTGSPFMNMLCESDGDAAEAELLMDFYRKLSQAIDWALGDLEPFQRGLQEVVEANQPRRKPKIAKGARDFLPQQMKIRETAFSKVVSIFKKHGAVSIDTPVFELRETLMGKYGEDSKLIYDLADQGGEILSLRYDLTVPFSRFCALHNTGNIKRYHVGKVYRRDQPQMNRGRFREFFQCDFDIAGTYSSMVPDSEVIKVMIDILNNLEIGQFCVKINHRLLLDAMMATCGVPEKKFRPICSAIDKLDKQSWEEVRTEMVEDKGLAADAADKIGQIVCLHGAPKEMLEKLKTDSNEIITALREHPMAKTALEELTLLFDFLEAMNALECISLDMSLARGLDYYTGVIYEAILLDANVGSIAAGGRYDYLVGSFAGKDIPAVGVSIGIERIFTILEAKLKAEAEKTGVPIRSTDTAVLVASIGSGMQKKRMQIANTLWNAGISAEFGFKPNPKMGDQINYALENGIPFMVLFGEDEIAQNKVKVKDMHNRTEITVELEELVSELSKNINANKVNVVV